MKSRVSVWVSGLLMIGSLSTGWAQSSLTDADLLAGSPRLLAPGTTLRITADSVYVVGKERYRFYQKLHRYLADSSTGGACSPLIISYEGSLRETQRAYDDLLRQYRAADSLSAHAMYRTQLSLGQLSRTLDQAPVPLGTNYPNAQRRGGAVEKRTTPFVLSAHCLRSWRSGRRDVADGTTDFIKVS